MKKTRSAYLILTAVLLTPMTANADLIVDTGTPTGEPRWVFSYGQYFAGEFSIDDAYSLTGVESYFSNVYGSAGNIDVSIHTGGGNIPGSAIYSTTIGIGATAALDWYGAFALDWLLDPGTYWLSFVPDSSIAGIMPGMAPYPLAGYAQGGTSGWIDFGTGWGDHLGIGFRIHATRVPEPGTLALLGIGLLGMAASRRRRQI